MARKSVLLLSLIAFQPLASRPLANEKAVLVLPPRMMSGEPELEQKFLAARAKDIRAGREPEFAALLNRAALSKDRETRVWALARLVEAGDLASYPGLAKDLGEHVRSVVQAGRGGVAPYRATAAGGPAYLIHHTSPFYSALAKTVRSNPGRDVSVDLYVAWCFNTLPNQKELIYEIASHAEAPISLKNPSSDPWNDPRFWIVTDWALAWGEAEDFEKIPQAFQNPRAKSEFERIAKSVTQVPGFFTCRNPSPLDDRPAEATAIVQPVNPAAPSPAFKFKGAVVKLQPPAPSYPIEAKNRRLMANLEVRLLLDTQGKVCGARTAPGPFLAFFAPVGLDYVSRWVFEPAMLNDVPQPTRFTLNMPFRLR